MKSQGFMAQDFQNLGLGVPLQPPPISGFRVGCRFSPFESTRCARPRPSFASTASITSSSAQVFGFRVYGQGFKDEDLGFEVVILESSLRV